MKFAVGAGALLVAAISVTAQAQDLKLAERAAMSRQKGPRDAQITVFEIADFQCPFCSRFAREVYPRIDSAYLKTGKVQWIFVNFPLPTHANAWVAAEAAMCAGGVAGMFWRMHDKLFARQREWSGLADPAQVFANYAREIGLPMPAYNECVETDKLASLLVRDVLNAASAGVNGTPAFVVNSEPMFAGYKPFEEWKDILESALKKATTK